MTISEIKHTLVVYLGDEIEYPDELLEDLYGMTMDEAEMAYGAGFEEGRSLGYSEGYEEAKGESV